jgi:hypothetical protein
MAIVKGLFITWGSIFICSFLLFRLFSPWAKTYWKRDITIALVQAVVITILLVSMSHSNNTTKFSDIINSLGKNTIELNREPGIIRSGTAGDPNEKLIKVGIGIDHTKITDDRLKQVVESYLSNSAALTNEHDWKKMLSPYILKIEEIGDSNNGKILAEKQSGASELNWKD